MLESPMPPVEQSPQCVPTPTRLPAKTRHRSDNFDRPRQRAAELCDRFCRMHGNRGGAGTRGGVGAGGGHMAIGHGSNDGSRAGGGKGPEMRQVGPPTRDSENSKPTNKQERRKLEQGNGGEHRPGGPDGLGPNGHGPNARPNAGPNHGQKHGPSGAESKKGGGRNQAVGSHAGGKSAGPKAGPNGGRDSKRG